MELVGRTHQKRGTVGMREMFSIEFFALAPLRLRIFERIAARLDDIGDDLAELRSNRRKRLEAASVFGPSCNTAAMASSSMPPASRTTPVTAKRWAMYGMFEPLRNCVS